METRACQSQAPARRPPGAQLACHHEGGHRSFVFRAYHFFAFTASNTRFFSSDSASLFFSSAFSRYGSFIRLASLMSSLPNCRFQRWNVTSEMLCLAHFHDAFAAIGLPQYADFLFGRGSFALHDLGYF